MTVKELREVKKALKEPTVKRGCGISGQKRSSLKKCSEMSFCRRAAKTNRKVGVLKKQTLKLKLLSG
ncbi:hypothetical protein [Paenibacillus sp. HW567]|uniref:hypothetical protein n=1 Tax=Paenibacillus sp. HW567 TaxID=1034769 RepID=UPI00037E4882|nr:hypothetical protein [Paenibacillus sp. HW567]